MPVSLWRPRLGVFLAISLGVAGCADAVDDGGTSDDGGEDWTTSTDEGVMLGTIEVTVDYAGDAMGDVTIGAFPICPPETPPVSFVRVPDPTFPISETLNNIEAGTYCVYAYVDEAPENPTFPGDEDPQGFSDDLTVDADTQSTSLTIVDPTP
jgi:hypothetical protein